MTTQLHASLRLSVQFYDYCPDYSHLRECGDGDGGDNDGDGGGGDGGGNRWGGG